MVLLQALMAQSAANLEEVRFEATSVSVRILVEQNCCHAAKSLLRGRIESSSHHPYWHVRLLLQLADVSMSERDEGGVISALNKCAEYARQVDAPYTRLVCCLLPACYPCILVLLLLLTGCSVVSAKDL